MVDAYQLEGIRYAYGGKEVLRLERLAIPAGRVTAITGPNGSGKSTLIALLAFLAPPAAGRGCFFGTPIQARSLLYWRRQVGLVSQNPYLLRGTVQKNVEQGLQLRGIPARQRRSRAAAVLERLGIGRYASHSARALSGGEAQKVALARALVLEPRVLLLDEPFSYLDQASVGGLENLLTSYPASADRTVVFSSHDRLQGQALSDHLVSLVDGRLVEMPLINLFYGKLRDGCFDTGRIQVQLAAGTPPGEHLVVDPEKILLSRQPADPTSPNHFPGRVVAIAEEAGDRWRISVEAGERFQVLIDPRRAEELDLRLKASLWLGFEAGSIKVF